MLQLCATDKRKAHNHSSTNHAPRSLERTPGLVIQSLVRCFDEYAELSIMGYASYVPLQQRQPGAPHGGQEAMAHLDGLLLPIKIISTLLVIFLLFQQTKLLPCCPAGTRRVSCKACSHMRRPANRSFNFPARHEQTPYSVADSWYQYYSMCHNSS